MAAKWTAPFHGVQHLKPLKRGFQITITDRGSFAECSVFLPGHNFNSTETTHDTANEARAHGEQQARLLEAQAVQS